MLLMDPRGYQERTVIKLAQRVPLEELKAGKILFYNNTKLDFCNYMTVFDRIKELFRDLGIVNFVEYTETVRGKDTPALEKYAAMLAEEKPPAAVVAFGDMGTSSSTTILTIALEKLGIPTVYMTAPPGSAITEGVAVYRAGNLCLCSVDVYQASTREEVAAQVDLKWDYNLSALTKNGENSGSFRTLILKWTLQPPRKTDTCRLPRSSMKRSLLSRVPIWKRSTHISTRNTSATDCPSSHLQNVDMKK
jgi:tRNA A37 threonylcarbamoyladenosine biosynthesis protein TsaE